MDRTCDWMCRIVRIMAVAMLPDTHMNRLQQPRDRAVQSQIRGELYDTY